MIVEEEIKLCIDNYIVARKQLLDIGSKYPTLIGGNDNIIGRIGELYGLLFLKSIGQKPSKVYISSNTGYDFVDDFTKLKTQVKVITSENKAGKSVMLVEPWDQFLLILLSDDYNIGKLGLISKKGLEKAINENPTWSVSPIVKKSMLGPKELIGKYGEVIIKPNVYAWS
jgi:hypothetical protein